MSFNTLDTVGGQPPAGSVQSVPDLSLEVAYHRAFEAIVWAIPAISIYRFRVGLLQQPGMADNVIAAYSKPLLPHSEVLTGNTVTPYIAATADLRKGPVVLEVPAQSAKASLYGQIVGAWQFTLADVGPAGIDKGAGGKYLLMPPGYDRPAPDGYIPLPSPTFRIAIAFRSVAAPGATEADAYAYAQTLKMYPLAEAANPKPRIADGRNHPIHTLPFYDIRALEDLHDIIDVEPVEAHDKVMIGLLASIGIERGKPFNPSGAMKEALERGVKDAYFYIQELYTKFIASNLYWPDRHWCFILVPDENQGFSFVADEAVHVDRRAAMWGFGTFYPRVLTMGRMGTSYLAPSADSSGRPLEAGVNYRLRVPADVPARQFWSLQLYDRATWNFIKNPTGRTGLSSFQKDEMKVNADGAVDIYWGPDEPKDLASNWLPTMGKCPYLLFRFYAPTEAFWDKSFKLPDVERL